MNDSQLGPLLLALDDLQPRITLDKRHCYRVDKRVIPGVTTCIKVMDAPQLDAWKVRVQVEGTARAAFRNPPNAQFIGEFPDEEILAAEVEYIDRLVRIAKEEFEHERIANAAADIGTQVHALIEHEIKTQLGKETEPPAASDDALFTFAGWRDWAKSAGLRPVASESRLCWPLPASGRPAEYCGTSDVIATFDHGPHKGRLAVIDAKPNARIYPERRMQLAAYGRPIADICEGVLGMIVAMPRDGGEIEMVPVEQDQADFAAFLSCLSLYKWKAALAKADRAKDKEEAA